MDYRFKFLIPLVALLCVNAALMVSNIAFGKYYLVAMNLFSIVILGYTIYRVYKEDE